MQTRTRDDVLHDLATKRHEAGRMTVKAPGYEAVHGEIDALVAELLAMG